MLKKERILIVEDEILTSDTIKNYLIKMGYDKPIQAFNYKDSVKQYKEQEPDIVLLDLGLGIGPSGIDFGYYLREMNPSVLIILLTGQLNWQNIERAKLIYPDGYLPKPISENSLLASIEFAFVNTPANGRLERSWKKDGIITIKNDTILLLQILYVEVRHIYSFIYLLEEEQPRVYRLSMQSILSLFPVGQIIQIHPSFAVHLRYAERYWRGSVELKGVKIPLSRSRRKYFIAAFDKYKNQ